MTKRLSNRWKPAKQGGGGRRRSAGAKQLGKHFARRVQEQMATDASPLVVTEGLELLLSGEVQAMTLRSRGGAARSAHLRLSSDHTYLECSHTKYKIALSPGVKISLPQLPRRIRLSRVELIELNPDQLELRALEADKEKHLISASTRRLAAPAVKLQIASEDVFIRVVAALRALIASESCSSVAAAQATESHQQGHHAASKVADGTAKQGTLVREAQVATLPIPAKQPLTAEPLQVDSVVLLLSIAVPEGSGEARANEGVDEEVDVEAGSINSVVSGISLQARPTDSFATLAAEDEKERATAA